MPRQHQRALFLFALAPGEPFPFFSHECLHTANEADTNTSDVRRMQRLTAVATSIAPNSGVPARGAAAQAANVVSAENEKENHSDADVRRRVHRPHDLVQKW